MSIRCRSAAMVALVAMLALGATAHAQNKCSAGKTKLAGKKAAAILGCLSKASKKGGDVSTQAPGCIAKAQSKFTAGSQKLDAKQDIGKPETVCPAGGGDEVARETDVDNFTSDVADDLDPGSPGAFTLSKCTAGKIKCAGKKAAAILGCQSKALGKGMAVDPLCISKAVTKFSDCYSKLEAKEAPPKPDNSNVCVAPDGDASAIETKVDNFSNAIVASYSGGPASCPTEIQFTGTSTNGVLDAGWTGGGHDSPVISLATVTVAVSGCSGTAPSCDVCSYSGPLENHAGQLHVQRCSNDSEVKCTSDAQCFQQCIGGTNEHGACIADGACPGGGKCSTAGGTCVFYFGSNLPFSAGGYSTCIQNYFTGGISGTANVDSSGGGAGTSAGTAAIHSVVYSGPTLSNPCAQCNGDGTANDNVRGGSCSSGPRMNLTCDANGSSANASFGTTSLDCPSLPGGVIANLPINLDNTTGTFSRTLSTANPLCRAPGFTTNRCQCDTCNSTAATPCSTNADCGSGICGGRRCLSGTNPGTPCSASSECPGGACGVPGLATAPNQCDGGSGDCVPDPGTPSPNDHVCSSGPFEQFCGPAETFRGCVVDGDCPFAGDTCSVGRFRNCYDNGVAGDVVASSGNPDPFASHQADPTLAAMFCVGPTTSPSVNATAGLPGLGRLELQGHSVDNGTP